MNSPNKRPISITIIAWYLIISACFILIYFSIRFNDPATWKFMSMGSIPVTVQLILFYLGLTISLISGVGFLKRQNWSRFLYTGWSGISIIIGLTVTSLRYSSLPGLVLFMVIALFLFRSKANDYFKSKQISSANEIDGVQEKGKHNIFLLVIKILIYIISAILIGMGSMMAFLNDEDVVGLVIIFILLGLIFLVVGLLLNRFQKWKRDTAIVLISGAGYAAFMVAAMIFISLSPEFRKSFQIPPDFSLFTDYSTGGSFIVLFVVAGLVLLWLQKSNQRSR
jgi:hypothetical protein